MTYCLRRAVLEDQAALARLIGHSARALSVDHYSAQQIEGALNGAFGVDTQLIADGTYFVIDTEAAEMVACGGWSFRRTLFGGDTRPGRDAAELDPNVDAAKIRAFFVHPDHARKGLGTVLLDRCECEARARGFKRLELMGTLPGVPLYAARGYVAQPPVVYELSAGLSIEFIPMTKRIGSNADR